MSCFNAFGRPSRHSLRGGRLSSRRRSRHHLPELLEPRRLLAADAYVELNLASNPPGGALVSDPSLAYAWGIATGPGGFSVSVTSGERSNSYAGDVAGSPFAPNTSQTVYVPLATGQVYNGNANEFLVHSTNPPGTTTPVTRGPAEFIYASLNGSIYGFNANIGQHAVAAASMPGASFTGLTLANNGTADQLYATDFLGGKVDVFDSSFHSVTTSGSFTDPNLPAGYRPFNVQALGGELYVSYAVSLVPPPAVTAGGPLPPTAAPGGVVDVFDANGNFVGRIASGSPLDQPWGMALAPASFGQFAGDLLVANHGDGKINAFDPTPSMTATTGTSLGTLGGADGNPFVVKGLLGVSLGDGANGGDAGSLYFTAGLFPDVFEPPPVGAADQAAVISPFLPPYFSHGLIGSIQIASSGPLVAVGTNATAYEGEPFSKALAAFGSADLPSPAANPLPTYSATIDWGDGSSTTAGTVVPTGNGGYLVVGSHTFTAVATDNYQVTIQDASGHSATATGTVQVTAATLSAKGLTVESHGLSIDGATVAAFLDTGGADPLANYSATINWGDGSTSAGTIGSLLGSTNATSAGDYFTVAGSHTYATTGDYTLTTTISDTDGSSATVQGTAHVAQATLLAHARSVESQGLAVNGATVAAFFDTGGADPLANYSATIDWGDGSTSAGTIGGGVTPTDATSVGGYFTVAGSHTYAATGDYTFTVAISDTDGSHATAQSTVSVATPILLAHARSVESQGLAVNGATVAAFYDTGGADPLANYSATIDWGDGSTSAGTIGSGVTPADATSVGGYFTVAGSHTYAATGDYTFTVTISDTDGSHATAQNTSHVALPTLAAHARSVESQGLAVNGATVAAFYDTGGADPLANYSATIDWGDGSTSAGTIGSLLTPMPAISAGDYFTVAGSHTYAAAGDYTLTVAIDDSDGTNATVTGNVSVATPTLEAKALPVISQGLGINDATVAAFRDTGGADPLANYSATIDWGDNSTSAGTITEIAIDPPGGGGPLTAVPGGNFIGLVFDVQGTHTYAAAGDFTFTVTISDSDGTHTTAQGTVHVAQAPLLAVGVPVVVTTGLAVDGAIVAAFTDAAGGDPLTNYNATIDWGDGSSTTAGTVTGSGNSFIVSGSHTYAAAGDYGLKIALADQDGASANVNGHTFIDVPAASFVANAFQEVLHRAPDDSGLSYWNQQIAGGLPPAQFANDLTHGPEFYATNVIDPAYQKYLGRGADAAGVSYWTSQMQQGLTDQQIEANFIASPEFYAHAGGTDSAWVNAMYQVVLGRPADSSGLSFWLAQLSGGASRSSVATGFAASQEREAQIIQDDYFTYLGRTASAADVNFWVAKFEQGATNEDIVSGFVGSSEYFKLHS